MKLLSSIVIVGMILGLALSFSLTLTSPSGASGKSSLQTVEVIVGPGDTVWDIAVEYGPRDADPRRLICDIAEMNDLIGYTIRPGEKILVPVGH